MENSSNPIPFPGYHNSSPLIIILAQNRNPNPFPLPSSAIKDDTLTVAVA